jgi:hypothetical protein
MDKLEVIKTTLWRFTSSRVPDEMVKKHLRFLFDQFNKQTRGWEITRKRLVDPILKEFPTKRWQYRADITIRQVTEEATSLLEVRVVLDQLLHHPQKFREHPYTWDEAPTAEEIESVLKDRANRWKQKPNDNPECASEDDDISHIEDMDTSLIIPPYELKIPQELLTGGDSAINDHEAFRGIYGRAAHIRRGLRAIDAFQRSAEIQKQGGKDKLVDLSRNHVLYWGPPAAAKYRILRGFKRLFPKGSHFTLDAPNATKAGIIRLFRTTFRDACPSLVFVEEIEKVPPDILTVWLAMLDERAEVSKFTHFKQDKVKVNFLCIATCNDRNLLNTVHKGSLGSRFGHQIYVPRPNTDEMRLVLQDRVREIGGNNSWVEVCLSLMKEFDTDDPREVKSWLDYGPALVDTDQSAYNDLKSMYRRQQRDHGVKIDDDFYPSDEEIARRSSSNGQFEQSMEAFRNGKFDTPHRRRK